MLHLKEKTHNPADYIIATKSSYELLTCLLVLLNSILPGSGLSSMLCIPGNLLPSNFCLGLASSR